LASVDITGLLHLPGTLISTPTDLTIASPYGGTILGLVSEMAVMIEQDVEKLSYPDMLGEKETVETVDLGRGWSMAGALRSFDEDAMQLFFPVTAAGAATGRRVVLENDTFRPGGRGSASAVPVLYVPDASAHRPSFLFHMAIPNIGEAEKLQLDLDQEAMLGFVFNPLKTVGLKRRVSWGLLADLDSLLE
jgi:hypothetical protein